MLAPHARTYRSSTYRGGTISVPVTGGGLTLGSPPGQAIHKTRVFSCIVCSGCLDLHPLCDRWLLVGVVRCLAREPAAAHCAPLLDQHGQVVVEQSRLSHANERASGATVPLRALRCQQLKSG
eukprot:6408665-Prymnesium_polylepis.1